MTRRRRIAIVSSMLDARFGGPPAVVAEQARALRAVHEVKIFGCEGGNVAALFETFSNPWLATPKWPLWWMRAPGLVQALEQWRPDIIHSHDVWLHGLHASWHAARRLRVPLVVTPHGIFIAPWRYSSWHKRLYRALFLDRMMRDVAAIHVLNEAEAEGCRKAGLPARTVVIPNGIPASEYGAVDRTLARRRVVQAVPQVDGRKIVLYLGRLWSGKGLDILPDAWAHARRPGWVLVVAGPDYRGFRAVFEKRLEQLGIAADVILTGHITGQTKRDLLQASRIFILPSHSEGFSMSVLEAMAAGTPSLITHACNFPELAQSGGGWCCLDRNPEIADALVHAMSLPEEELEAMGASGRQFGAEQFTSEAVAGRLSALYETL